MTINHWFVKGRQEWDADDRWQFTKFYKWASTSVQEYKVPQCEMSIGTYTVNHFLRKNNFIRNVL